MSADKDTNSTPSRATATYPNTRALLGRFVTGFYTHLGVSRILSKLQANFYWANMRKDVHAFVSQCTTCQQTKTPTRRPPGLLQPIPTPERCWEDLSLDFIQLKNNPLNLIGDSLNVAAHSEVTTRDAILRKLHSNLHKAQEAMKRWADTCRRDLHFDIGDLVYVRLRPRRQASVTGPYLSKLQKRYFSPFKVLEKPLSLPPDIEDNQPILEPAAILNWKLSNDPDDPQQLVLIQWQGFPLEETSWEPWSQIKAQFHLEDKATLEPGGGVRPISQYDPPDPLSVQEEVITYGRPQRIRNKPPHLDDYVTE
ncbi:uncharacterized protein LOC109802728 [Cajanus cajan]|uniref:uncharacterized protein LOC109802728 n=1 Tax=Cajanus cajan TaxID=3821 RepID=UPI00098DCE1A|nr:uncharacterized protein LOC109802728 [Cajanus cajan]